ncbi:hypothetical protein J27TS8_25070 [Robertmurraya siralis]|uniref:Homeodomain phBC6A51-type domain-containing protein n=1 Tax=Robertmurraya siralis TaxID=77777 RepID=A0A919WIR9_9BACI|nr:phBC6A51 family helix-turn-helix protein [Robertmurraya siralis]GIN62514.1 hypothetical protein J27TS8_25070 [Robertmurraya siralis]
MKKDTRLNEKQIRILEDYFVRTVAGETMEQIATDNGISRKTLSQWKNTEHGKQLYGEYMKELSINDVPMFYQKLSEGVAKNSFKHLELFAKIHGLLASAKSEVTNINENNNIVQDGLSKDRLAELEVLLDGKPIIKRVK